MGGLGAQQPKPMSGVPGARGPMRGRGRGAAGSRAAGGAGRGAVGVPGYMRHAGALKKPAEVG